MQRCQSGRQCSLGTAVYGNVPRVRIPVSAPTKTALNPLFFYLLERDLASFTCLANFSLLEPGAPLCTRVLVSFQLPPENYRSLRSLNANPGTPTPSKLEEKSYWLIFLFTMNLNLAVQKYSLIRMIYLPTQKLLFYFNRKVKKKQQKA